jgi:hypothetical protein
MSSVNRRKKSNSMLSLVRAKNKNIMNTENIKERATAKPYIGTMRTINAKEKTIARKN